MDIFGETWTDHAKKIKENWKSKIKPEDTVILPGDFSWALALEDTYQDFEFLNNLPGKKIMLKGNHDYWWNSLTKLKKYLNENNFQNIEFLQNNSFEADGKIIARNKTMEYIKHRRKRPKNNKQRTNKTRTINPRRNKKIPEKTKK